MFIDGLHTKKPYKDVNRINDKDTLVAVTLEPINASPGIKVSAFLMGAENDEYSIIFSRIHNDG